MTVTADRIESPGLRDGSPADRVRRRLLGIAGAVMTGIAALLAVVATFTAAASAAGAIALMLGGLALMFAAWSDVLLPRRPRAPVPAPTATGPSPSPTDLVPHHRAARGLLGETVREMNSADDSSPWSIERDGSWASDRVFDYAVFRRNDADRPARIGIDLRAGAADIARTALSVAIAHRSGGVYDGILILGDDLGEDAATELAGLARGATGIPCRVVGWHRTSASDAQRERDQAMLAVADALESLAVVAADSPRRASAVPAPAAYSEPASRRTDAPERRSHAVSESTATARTNPATLAPAEPGPPAETREAFPAAPIPVTRPTGPAPVADAPTLPIPASETGTSEFEALLRQAAVPPQDPPLRSRGQR